MPVAMSAFGGKADIGWEALQCPLLTQGGHSQRVPQSNTGGLFAPFNGEWIACHFHAHLPRNPEIRSGAERAPHTFCGADLRCVANR
jgi:hypothetical protein